MELEDARNKSDKALKAIEQERHEETMIIRGLEDEITDSQTSVNRAWFSPVKQFLKKLFFWVMQGIKYHLGLQSNQLRYIDTNDLVASMATDDPQTIFQLLKRADAENYLRPQKRGVGYIVYKALKLNYKKFKNTLKFVLRFFRAVKKRLPI
jgi:hypothetical protein